MLSSKHFRSLSVDCGIDWLTLTLCGSAQANLALDGILPHITIVAEG